MQRLKVRPRDSTTSWILLKTPDRWVFIENERDVALQALTCEMRHEYDTSRAQSIPCKYDIWNILKIWMGRIFYILEGKTNFH